MNSFDLSLDELDKIEFRQNVDGKIMLLQTLKGIDYDVTSYEDARILAYSKKPELAAFKNHFDRILELRKAFREEVATVAAEVRELALLEMKKILK